ncbi:PREDICTED: LOW QUALITY PROTEIN: uncharacterized protein LOC109470336 [Branchiostoma belcheri]|uniref:LOW QUALITY PROTEIN: uncharacterized protein LOC109470336 n=1 Tax=Branchiostoma belcheri TaxID=7741 RepID=A0A6P4Y711_BRABE|nr:PREDICTED: LOW QUALITY PROTEIN: uncharacterized protein LOC109470336 [Branchiostoma belcheri]
MEEEEEDRHTEEKDEENGNPKGFLKCTECDKTFVSASKLKSHARVHAGQKLFGCKHCPAKFVYENQLKLHDKIHEGSGAYACAQCPTKFTLAWGLKLHEKTHVKKKAFSCSECSANFDSEGSLKEHKESHRFPYACMQCTARFSTARDLWEHENVHNDEGPGSDLDEPAHVEISVAAEQDSSKNVSKKKLHGCRNCSTWFVSTDHLQKHKCTNSKTPIEEKPYQCSKCPEKFAYKKTLKEHEKKHAKKTQFSAGASSEDLSKTVNLTDSNSLAGPKKKSLKEHERKNAQKTQECTTEASSELESISEIVDLTDDLTEGPQDTTEYDSLQESQFKSMDEMPLQTCPHCNASFATSWRLKSHMTMHAGKLVHHCSKCPASFTSKVGLKKHEKRHSRKQSYSCTQCPAKFTVWSNLQRHRKSHKGAKPFSCPECPAKFVSYVEKMSHMDVHGKAHSCSHCGAKFTHYSSLVSHQRCHQVEKKKVYSCTSCPAKFAQPHSLRLHRRIHGTVDYNCRECPATFQKRGHLESHMLVHTGGDKPHKCKFCSAQYKCISHLTKHEKLHQEVDVVSMPPNEASPFSNEDKQCVEQTGNKRKHRDQEATRPAKKSYNCKECPAKFTSASHLWSHMQVHFGGEKPHHCPHCSATFASPYHLTRHLEVHKEDTDLDNSSLLQDAEATSEVPRKKQKQQPPASNVRYSCSICSEEFLHPQDLKVHWRTHSREKIIYSCDECPATFPHLGHLKRHQKAHKNDGLYHCPYCSAKYDARANLTMHMRAQHLVDERDRPYVCPECPANYLRPDHLRSHLKVHREGPVQRPNRCQHCTATFGTPSELTKHMKLHTLNDGGNEGVKEHLCPKCPAGFRNAHDLSQHLEKVHINKSNVCTECPARFSRPDHLRNHMLLHSEVGQDQRLYHCNYCSAKFHAKYHLTSHERLHSPSNPETAMSSYKCPHCLRRFKTVKSMKNHIRSCLLAKENRPHTCSHCPAKFAFASTLKSHMKTHIVEEPGNSPQDAAVLSSTTELPSPTTSSLTSAGDDGKNYHCEECPGKFSSEYHLKRHQEIHNASNARPYSCSFCTAKFSNTGRLVEHVKIHKQESPPPPPSESETVLQLSTKKRGVRVIYRCNVCDATFTTQVHLNTHKKVHSQDNLYSCSKCPAKFDQQSYLEDHMKTHSASVQESSKTAKPTESTGKSKDSAAKKTKWFTCQYCKSKFRGASRLAVHVNVHHWEEKQRSKSQPASQNIQDRFNGRNYKCPQCPSKFTNAVSLTIHQRVHQGDRPHKCQKCLATFSTPGSLKRHVDSRHGTGMRRHTCPYCPTKFLRLGHLKVHLIVHTREGPGLHHCTHCTAKFLHKTTLTHHLKVHNVKSYKCNRCSLEFSSREDHRKHQRTHSEKPASTKQPNNAASSSKVQNHEADKKTSSADRPYTCQKCSRKFLSSQQLEYHMVWHSGDRRHECSLCSQTFPTVQSLKEHRKTHAGERPFRCPMCPADFERNSSLKRHVENKHFKENDESSTGVSPTTQRVSDEPQKGSSDGSNKNSPKQQKTNTGREKFYSCSTCSQKFKRFQDLKKHRKSHSRGKPAKRTGKRVTCPECKASFSDLRTLERHQRIHTGEKPFACPMCSVRFARKDHLLRHVATKHAESEPANPPTLNQEPCPKPHKKVYNCPECPARFSTAELLTRHKKIHPIFTKETPNKSSSASNLATLEVVETQVVHEPGAASHVETVVVANLEQLPIHGSEDATVDKVLQTDDKSRTPESSEFPQYHKGHQQSGSSSSAGHLAEGNTTQVATVSREAATMHDHASHLMKQLQKGNEQVPAPGNVPLLQGLWQRSDTTSPPQGIVPVGLSYGEALQAGETILQASMANSYYCGWNRNTIQQQVTQTSSSANSPGIGQVLQVSSARTNQQMPLDDRPPNQGQANSHNVVQNNENRRQVQHRDEGKHQDIRYFCIGCKQVFATDKDLKDHLQGSEETPGQDSHKIVVLQKKTTTSDQEKTSACSEANVLVVPRQSMNRVVANCSHVFCVLCAGKVNINDLSHHVRIKHGIYSLNGEYPFGQATSCMTCSRRLYGEEDVQKHTSKRHIVLRDTAGPFLAYDNTQRISDTDEDTENDRQLTDSANRGNNLLEESSLSTSDLCNRMGNNSSSEKPGLPSAAMTTLSTKDDKEMLLSKGAFSLSDAQKKKFLMISRAADACLKKKRYLVIRGSDGTDRSACSSPLTDCSSSHDTTQSPPLNTLEPQAQPTCHIKIEEGEKSSACASSSLNEQPNSNNNSQYVAAKASLQKQLAMVAGILSSTLRKTSSTELNPKMKDQRNTTNSQVTTPIATLQTKGGKGSLSSVSIKTEPVSAEVGSADVGMSAPSDAEGMEDLGDVTAINEPLKSIKEDVDNF